MRARDALIRLGQKNTGRVFTYTAEGIKSTWRFMLEKLGIADLHFHDLRHEAISRLFELGTLDVMEIAAISGHKNLSMLKRYTHLSAQKLARKLETGKNRNSQHVIDMLVPYPAIMEEQSGIYRVRLLDVDDIEVRHACSQAAIRAAQDTLLRRIVMSVRMNDHFPLPDQYMDDIDDARVVMIDPLGLDDTSMKA